MAGVQCRAKPISTTFGIGSQELDQEGRTITAEYPDFLPGECVHTECWGGAEAT